MSAFLGIFEWEDAKRVTFCDNNNYNTHAYIDTTDRKTLLCAQGSNTGTIIMGTC